MFVRRMVGLGIAVFVVGSLVAPATEAVPKDDGQKKSTWTEILPNGSEPAPRWSARAGLQAVTLGDTVYVMGGRVPKDSPIPGDSTLLNDVWSSDDQGETWINLVPTGIALGMWAPRAYFAAVTKGDYMYVLGGQDFNVIPNPACGFPPGPCPPGVPPIVSSSQFFNDVWRSPDGKQWEQMTPAAPWAGRAGLSAAVLGGDLYVFAGSVNDDAAVIGGPPVREYFNDVWRSQDDGRTWEQMTEALAVEASAREPQPLSRATTCTCWGERSASPASEPGCTPPYFNDVWRSRNGRPGKGDGRQPVVPASRAQVRGAAGKDHLLRWLRPAIESN